MIAASLKGRSSVNDKMARSLNAASDTSFVPQHGHFISLEKAFVGQSRGRTTEIRVLIKPDKRGGPLASRNVDGNLEKCKDVK